VESAQQSGYLQISRHPEAYLTVQQIMAPSSRDEGHGSSRKDGVLQQDVGVCKARKKNSLVRSGAVG
jgi:hypothetical protein